MSAEPFKFEEYANSSRGLLARNYLPNNAIAYLANISAISYEIINLTDGLPGVTGSLTVADVMFASLQTWTIDNIGYTFLWELPGSLLPLAGKTYRIILTFTTSVALGSKNFIRTWEADTKDPAAVAA